MNENYIVLEGEIENSDEDCTFAKIRKRWDIIKAI